MTLFKKFLIILTILTLIANKEMLTLSFASSYLFTKIDLIKRKKYVNYQNSFSEKEQIYTDSRHRYDLYKSLEITVKHFFLHLSFIVELKKKLVTPTRGAK